MFKISKAKDSFIIFNCFAVTGELSNCPSAIFSFTILDISSSIACRLSFFFALEAASQASASISIVDSAVLGFVSSYL